MLITSVTETEGPGSSLPDTSISHGGVQQVHKETKAELN